jgi:hypothetical protein
MTTTLPAVVERAEAPLPALLGSVRVRVRLSVFREEILEFELQPLLSLGELLEATGVRVPLELSVVCWINGYKVRREHWPLIKPKAGTLVLFAFLPEDGRTAALIGGSLLIATLTGGVFAGVGAVLGTGALATAAAAGAAGATGCAGRLALNVALP